MNLSVFIKHVDALTESISYQQLKFFLHETARILPEGQRTSFLERLEAFADEKKIPECLRDEDKDFKEVYKTIDKLIGKIEEGEFFLSEIMNEAYDEWYDVDEEEFYYEDPENISDKIDDICSFIHKCLDHEKYQEGAKIGRRLLGLMVEVHSDYDDRDLSFSDLVSEGFLTLNVNKTVIEIIYCAYHAYDMKDRAEIVLDILSKSGIDDMKLEHIFQYGTVELEGVEEFLNLLIDHIGSKTGRLEEILIKEAVALKNDFPASIDTAIKYIENHPGILLELLKKNQGQPSREFLDLGMRGLDLIDRKYLIRSEVALMTASYALALGENQLIESCYIEAFRSRSSAKNYLEALFYSKDRLKSKGALSEILNEMAKIKQPLSHDLARNTELAENKVSINTIAMLKFFDGRFEDVLNQHMNRKEVLGWTATFMKQGLALFSFLLFQGEALQSGVRHILEMLKYDFNIPFPTWKMDMFSMKKACNSQLMIDYMFKWKEDISIDDVYGKKIISKLEKMVENRVEGIMNANRRKYYSECAAFIAALGEVKASRGNGGEKQIYMDYFRRKFPRRSAFKTELQVYGYKK